jgi:hypothetical protein
MAIVMGNTKFSGTIPHTIGALSKLKIIRMARNKIDGTIPRQVAALPNLVNIDFFENRITGTLPYFASEHLETLDLGHNDLHGSIPNKFLASKKSLQQLFMSQNRLSGSIPEILMDLTRLDTLDLSSNILHGTIPKNIGNLLLLQHLKLNNNFLVGPIPHTLATSSQVNGKMGDLLETIHLQDNQLSGTIPLQFEYLPKLNTLMIHENKLTGTVPANICSENINKSFFQGTQPNSENGRNYCDAISCPVDMVALDGTAPCVACNNLHYNPYIGQTRSCNTVLSQREILKHFYENTSQNDGKWNGVNDWEDDKTFLCDFTGVTCDKDFHVTEIKLKGRGLKGTISDFVGFLPYLKTFDVSDNELAGFLPSDLRWAPLELLDISGNSIRGVVPPTLCDKAGVNSNGNNGSYDCNKIACPIGTYSPSGRERIPLHTCSPCHHNNPTVLGSKSCREFGVASGAFGFIVFFVTLSVAVAVFVVVRMKRRSRIDYQDTMQELEMQRPITALDLGDGQSIGSIDRAVSGTPTSARNKKRRTGSGRGGMYADLPDDRGFTHSSALPYPDAENSSTVSGMSKGSAIETSSIKSGKSRGSNTSDESNNKDIWLDVPRIT